MHSKLHHRTSGETLSVESQTPPRVLYRISANSWMWLVLTLILNFDTFSDGAGCWVDTVTTASLSGKLGPRSSSGLGRWPFTPVTRVQIPYGVHITFPGGFGHLGMCVLVRRKHGDMRASPFVREFPGPRSRAAGSTLRCRRPHGSPEDGDEQAEGDHGNAGNLIEAVHSIAPQHAGPSDKESVDDEVRTRSTPRNEEDADQEYQASPQHIHGLIPLCRPQDCGRPGIPPQAFPRADRRW